MVHQHFFFLPITAAAAAASPRPVAALDLSGKGAVLQMSIFHGDNIAENWYLHDTREAAPVQPKVHTAGRSRMHFAGTTLQRSSMFPDRKNIPAAFLR